MRYILSLILFCLSVGLNATNYYVKNGGSDAANGLTDGTAWANLTKVESYGASPGFSPGDTIFLQRGSIWKDNLYIPNSGTSEGQITYTAYGDGELPIITGRGSVTGWSTPGNWTQVGATDVWYLSWAFGTSTRPRIWLNDTEVETAPNAASVSSSLPHFFDGTAGRLYVYSPSPQTPADYYTTLEHSAARNECVYLLRKDYITLSYLDMRGARTSCYIIESSNVIVENCKIGADAQRYGVYVAYHSAAPHVSSDNGILRNNIIDSGYRFNNSWIYGDPYFCIDGVLFRYANNWKVYGNTIVDWNHTQLAIEGLWSAYYVTNIEVYDNDLSCPSLNYGRGIGIDIMEGKGTGNKIHHNYIHDIATQNQINGAGLEFYYNIINTVRGVTGYPAVGRGIYLSIYADDTYPSEQKFYNNVIANCANEGIRLANYHGDEGYFIEDNEFVNNILFENDTVNGYHIYIEVPTGPIENKIKANTYKNNLIYSEGVTDLIYYRGSAMTVAEFNAENGNAYGEVITNNIGGDPLFVGAADFNLQVLSPAIDAGVNVGLNADYDYKIVPVNGIVDIGAYEYPGEATASDKFGTIGGKFAVDRNGRIMVIR